ncbi:hypothetical protein EP47_05005 [Legionella norrlandica]|uniref:Flagellar motor switch protein FliG n=1 Tax=Legionella norrlandica TaxID=1498499 RepID=A0A0A2T8G0_9GAMM|nr:flagellar motor switch protein FliG [Legionella norrlandica]KGP63723.1 hypothetical protein EP47_05005 [Legionella norrlandica]
MTSSKDAAIILLGMGESCASEVLKVLGQKDVETIIDIMNSMGDLSEHEVIQALNEFFRETHKMSGLNADSGNYIKNSLVNAVGSHKASSLMESSSLTEEQKGIELLKWQPIHLIEDALRDEHPQIITVVLLCLENHKAAQILNNLPKATSKEVIRRMTNLGPLSESGMKILSNYLEQFFTRTEKFKVLNNDVINKAANIISFLDMDTEKEIISYLGKEDKEITEKIQEKIFPFERLAQLDSRSLQTLLNEVDNNQLTLSLKGADDSVKQAFFKNMSSKSAELIQEDLDSMGPVRLKEVILAQKNIVRQAKQLAAANKIVIPTARRDAGFV